MVVNAVGAAVGTGFGVKLGHVVNVLLSEAAGIIDCGKFCRNLGKAMVLQSADVVAGLCSLALAVGAGVAFHGGIFGLINFAPSAYARLPCERAERGCLLLRF